MLTEADTLAAKKWNTVKERSAPVAALLPVEPVVPVAMVMPSTVLDDGTNSEYVDALFFVPHFFFNCSIAGPSASAKYLSVLLLMVDLTQFWLILSTLIALVLHVANFQNWKKL